MAIDKALKNIPVIIAVMAALCWSASCTPVQAENSRTVSQDDSLRVEWDASTIKILATGGGYGRVHRLNDGRLMGVYGKGGDGYVIYSSDNGYNWTEPKAVLQKFSSNGTSVGIHNCEFGQLSAGNPYHPGRIIYAVNLRPDGQASTKYPYSIAYKYSDNEGVSWSEMYVPFQSHTWDTDVLRGCWEPFILELPDGTVQMYFSDETPYYSQGKGYQNISVLESKDGGDTWSSERIIAYADKTRDGMPTGFLLDGVIYIAVEHFNTGARFYPQVVSTTVEDNWSEPVLNGSPWRFDIFLNSMESSTIYNGAPYLIRTDDCIAVSWQTTVYGDAADESHAMMEVAVCRISEIRNGKFTTMRACSRPLVLDVKTNRAKWNSLCDLGDNCLLAVASTKVGLVSVRGKIINAKQ